MKTNHLPCYRGPGQETPGEGRRGKPPVWPQPADSGASLSCPDSSMASSLIDKEVPLGLKRKAAGVGRHLHCFVPKQAPFFLSP